MSLAFDNHLAISLAHRKANSDTLVRVCTNADDVATNRVDVVVGRAVRTTDDAECVLLSMSTLGVI